jgi:hypothetical protein
VSEFWGYGIDRSGMSREEYTKTVRNLFRTYYLYSAGGFEEGNISNIGELFKDHSKPREIATIILI